METITVSYQVIEKDFTWWDKAKRKRRSLLPRAKDFLATAREKIKETASAIAFFFKRCNDYAARVNEIYQDLREDWEMGFMQFLFGPPTAQTNEAAGNYTEFSTGNVASSMMGAVVGQNGFVSEEQVAQFQEIAQNAKENTKRVKAAVKAIEKVSANETEVSRLVYQVLSKLESDSFKRSEYQAKRRQDHQLMQKKCRNLRRGL